MKRPATSLLVLRFTNSCSTPHSSGNSERIVRPPRAARISDVWPMAGFAEIPEKPSDPPHFSQMHKPERGLCTARTLIHFHEPGKGLADRFRHHAKLRSALLLFEQQKRLGELRIA